MAEFHYTGMAEVLNLNEIINYSIGTMKEDALRNDHAERICLFWGIDMTCK